MKSLKNLVENQASYLYRGFPGTINKATKKTDRTIGKKVEPKRKTIIQDGFHKGAGMRYKGAAKVRRAH